MQQGVPECRRFFESLLGLFTTSDGADATVATSLYLGVSIFVLKVKL